MSFPRAVTPASVQPKQIACAPVSNTLQVHHVRCVLQLFGPTETTLCHLRRRSLIRGRHPGRRAVEICLLGHPPGKSSQFLHRAQQRWHIVPRYGRWPLRTGRSVGNSCLQASCFSDRLRWKEYPRGEETSGQKKKHHRPYTICQRLRLRWSNFGTEPLKLHSDVLIQAFTTSPNSCKSVERICGQRSVLTPSVSRATTELDWGGDSGNARVGKAPPHILKAHLSGELLRDCAEDKQVQPLPRGIAECPQKPSDASSNHQLP